LARFTGGDRMFKQAQRHGRSARGWRNMIWAGYVASKWPVATASEAVEPGSLD
jgi:hypothetical protein